MPKIKRLSGGEVISIFKKFGFEVVSQRGSHIKLRRVLPNKISQGLTIPNHKELSTGTLKAIYRQGSRFISEEELFSYFYSN